MPNHYHLVTYLRREADVSNIMRSISVSYTRSFNLWHARSGHVFERDFQAKHIDADGYLAHVCRYVHLNPVKANLVRTPEEWEHSDYREWSTAFEDNLPNIRVRNMFVGNASEYKAFVMDYAEEKKKEREIKRLLFGDEERTATSSRGWTEKEVRVPAKGGRTPTSSQGWTEKEVGFLQKVDELRLLPEDKQRRKSEFLLGSTHPN